MKGVSMLNSKERGSLILKWIPLKLKYINKIFKKLEAEIDSVEFEDYKKIYVKLCKSNLMYQSGARLKFVNVNYLPSENKNTIYIDLCEIAIDSRNCLIKYINFKELPTLQNKTEAYLYLCKKATESAGTAGLEYINLEQFLSTKNYADIYLDFCYDILNNSRNQFNNNVGIKSDKLKYINYNKLPSYNRNKHYTNLCKVAIKNNAYALKSVKIEHLLLKNRNKIYAELCKMAVKKDGEALKYVKYNLLPERNRDKIYAKLCKIAVRYSSLVLEFVNFSLINKKFYLDIYKSAINGSAFSLYEVKYKCLPQKNRAKIYADLCKLAVSNRGKTIEYIKFENLPYKNRNKVYLNLFKIATNDDWSSIEYVNFENLPVENRENFYLDICKEFLNVRYNNKERALKLIKKEYLPENLRNLSDEEFKETMYKIVDEYREKNK